MNFSPPNNMKYRFIFLCLLILSCLSFSISAPKSTADNYIPQDFDVLQYKIYVDIDSLNAEKLDGFTRVRIAWNTDQDGEFYIDLHDLKIDSIKIEILPIFEQNIII